MITVEIPLKLPSCNDYINACRLNKYAGAKMKAETEEAIGFCLQSLPRFKKPITIHFHWIEATKRRDLDGIAFGKKFILDALTKGGYIKDDSHRYVTGFRDTFEYGEKNKVIVTIKEKR